MKKYCFPLNGDCYQKYKMNLKLPTVRCQSSKIRCLLSVVCCLLSIISCKTKTTAPCKYGDPTAIFSDTMHNVKKHFFQVKDGTGIEMVAFKDNYLLEVEQSGCEDIQQQFSFIIHGKFMDAPDSFWIQLAVKQFKDMSKMSPKLAPFTAWAEAIEVLKDKIKLSEPTEIQPKFLCRIDKVVSPEQATLVVLLSQKK